MENIIASLISHYHNFDFKLAVMVFLAYLTLDTLYAKYILSISRKNEYKAATLGVIINILIALGVVTYTKNMLYIIPLSIGSWIGTFYAVKKERTAKSKTALAIARLFRRGS